MTEQNTQVINGELTYADKVIEKIVGLALESVDGLLAVDGGFLANLKDKLVNTENVRSGVNVEVGKKQVAVDLSIVAEYQKHLPTIYKAIQTVVESEVKRMTDLEVVEINVEVSDIKTRAQFEADSISLQDRVSDATQSVADFTGSQVKKTSRGIEELTAKEPRVI
ncbi:Asp23/Gls24 family envelope stress response protein [Streptococcus suis]|uniref:Asp23/Gls24 family envelope stress response protein n=1 Tax=Streptococcus suis TaxID=1307 RepID=UPI000CF52AE0|nr:Asp23/Gls24 family envelope stress response protein [Streptococcus suis]NQP18666.1 Asp23/Gls24 family envelope stress response protein [Streptococcus suis]NQP64341.1 Asp23/Gls24 family envelope stress response protein [Streptococcus suis]